MRPNKQSNNRKVKVNTVIKFPVFRSPLYNFKSKPTDKNLQFLENFAGHNFVLNKCLGYWKIL